MRNVVLAVIGLVFTVGIANATVPDPTLCSVEPCDSFGDPPGSAPGMVVYPCPVPGGSAEFVCNIRNADNDPIPDAFVEINILVPANHCICPEAVLTGTTDALGNVTFNISAGGCTFGMDAVEIIANGMVIRTYQNLKSPDWDSTSDCDVDLADYIVFGTAFSTGAPGCHDYFNDGSCELGDFIVFGEAWGHVCCP
jgi:hypothetical protein